MDNIEYIKEIDRFAEILKREARNTVKEGLNRSLMIPTLRQLWRIHGYFEISQIYTSRSTAKEKREAGETIPAYIPTLHEDNSLMHHSSHNPE